MFSPPSSPPISTGPGHIRRIQLQILAGDVAYLQIFPHIPSERRWRKVCNARDLPMITEAAVPLKITRLEGGEWGYKGHNPMWTMCSFPHIHTCRVEGTEVHCAFIRLWCRQISSLEWGPKRQEREWVALLGTMTVSGVKWCGHHPFIHIWLRTVRNSTLKKKWNGGSYFDHLWFAKKKCRSFLISWITVEALLRCV